MKSSRRPLMIVNIHLKQNHKAELKIYEERPFKWLLREFIRQNNLKQTAIPYIKEQIIKQMNHRKIKVSTEDLQIMTFNDSIWDKKSTDDKKIVNSLWIKEQTPKRVLKQHNFTPRRNAIKIYDDKKCKSARSSKSKQQSHNKPLNTKNNEVKAKIISNKRPKPPLQKQKQRKINQFVIPKIQQQLPKQQKNIEIKKLIIKNQHKIRILFSSLTSKNPSNIERIHADYITFQSLNEVQLVLLQQFFEKMSDIELSKLTYEAFKQLLIKYFAKKLITNL